MPGSAQKISISLSDRLLRFVEQYKLEKGCKSRSQVIEEALTLLETAELETAYREASSETDPDWENVAADGLNDEAW